MIPKDPVILLSFINTKLRDEYGNRDRRKFCVIDESRQYENLRLSQE